MTGYGMFEYVGLAAILAPCIVFMFRRVRRLVGRNGGCGGCSCGGGKAGAGHCS